MLKSNFNMLFLAVGLAVAAVAKAGRNCAHAHTADAAPEFCRLNGPGFVCDPCNAAAYFVCDPESAVEARLEQCAAGVQG